MSDKTKIEWTDATWNPVTGCTKVSQGCKHCYAEREWPRLTKLVPAYAGRDFTDVRTHADRLDQPLHWKKPRRVFVNSMSDLFHESVPDEFIDRVFAVMALAPQHTFQVLTKRADRMREYLSRPAVRVRIGLNAMAMCLDAAVSTRGRSTIGTGILLEATDINPGGLHIWPLPNVWLGVSVEGQASADERIPMLLQTPAIVRWISAEPLLGPVDLTPAYFPCPNHQDAMMDPETGAYECCRECDHTGIGDEMGIDWVVVGGESGPKARPMHPDWPRNLRDQCAAAGVPFLFKQHGEWIDADAPGVDMLGSKYSPLHEWPDGKYVVRIGKRAAGRLLDGVQHDGYPEAQP